MTISMTMSMMSRQWYDNVYDDSLESDRLKTINIKPWTPITYRNCVLYWICADRYHSDN